jgi:hypothetical protein
MKPNTYAIVRRALEEGALCGLNRSNKHSQAVDPGMIDLVADAVVADIRRRAEAGEKLLGIAADHGVSVPYVSMIGSRQRRISDTHIETGRIE